MCALLTCVACLCTIGVEDLCLLGGPIGVTERTCEVELFTLFAALAAAAAAAAALAAATAAAASATLNVPIGPAKAFEVFGPPKGGIDELGIVPADEPPVNNLAANFILAVCLDPRPIFWGPPALLIYELDIEELCRDFVPPGTSLCLEPLFVEAPTPRVVGFGQALDVLWLFEEDLELDNPPALEQEPPRDVPCCVMVPVVEETDEAVEDPEDILPCPALEVTVKAVLLSHIPTVSADAKE
uniref:Secreted protein n=1 Tax=Glossina brevipalpis TaxID=37001 RepID=A0A1A9WY70_9MUSC